MRSQHINIITHHQYLTLSPQSTIITDHQCDKSLSHSLPRYYTTPSLHSFLMRSSPLRSISTQHHDYTTPLLHTIITTEHHHDTTLRLHNTIITHDHYHDTTSPLLITFTTQHHYYILLRQSITITQHHHYSSPTLTHIITTSHLCQEALSIHHYHIIDTQLSYQKTPSLC